MKYLRVGRSGLKVSAFGLGTMTFGQETDANTSARLFDRALDVGINHFDCADFYGGGQSESILGAIAAKKRKQIILATKAYYPTGTGPNDRGLSRLHLIGGVEDSLRRLHTDYIDLFYLHHYDIETPLEETLRAVDDLVRQGKIRYLGLSNFTAWQTTKALGICQKYGFVEPIVVQPMYNLLKRQVEVEILPMAQSEGLGVITYSPLGGGVLTAKYLDDQNAQGRLVANKAYRIRYGLEYIGPITNSFRDHCQLKGWPMPAAAIAWVRDHPVVTSVLIGARNEDQLEQCLKAQDYLLTSKERQEIAALSYDLPSPLDRNDESQNLIDQQALNLAR